MYISREGKIQRSITCTSRNVHVYMTHYMYLSGCHGVTPHPPRHRYGCHRVTPTPMSSLFIEHVYTVGQTLPRGDHLYVISRLMSIYSTTTLKPDNR